MNEVDINNPKRKDIIPKIINNKYFQLKRRAKVSDNVGWVPNRRDSKVTGIETR